MKNIVFILLLILSSCGPEAVMFQRQYVIENSSGVPIELQFYRDGELNRFASTLLSAQEQLNGQILERSGGPWGELSQENNQRLPASSFETDSVRLIFNNEKIMVYQISFVPLTFLPSERNLLQNSDYTSIGGDRFLFTINENDFENAEDCSGNCD